MRAPLFADAPARVYWELTRACDLACLHCRARAAPYADPRDLSTEVGMRILCQLAEVQPVRPHVIFTGGDPLKRGDLFELIAGARSLGLHVSVSPSATPLLTEEAIDRLRVAGVEAISLSIDGSDSGRHDALRGVPGTFERTLIAAKRARAIGLAFQVNTLVSRRTLDDLPAIESLVRSLRADRWSLFFLVSVGRGTVLPPISAQESEDLLGWLTERAKVPGVVITTTEAPHFRRVALQHREERSQPPTGHGAGMRDGAGVMFIAHDGQVTPSGFLPLSAGNAKLENPLRIYRESALFRSLRDVDHFRGRCGYCEYRTLCGGSRARAYAATGDPLAEDPLCVYEPRTLSVAFAALNPSTGPSRSRPARRRSLEPAYRTRRLLDPCHHAMRR
jgi:MoaA/NifB/PqqE/SkfB family radical SAM enzyme